MDFGLIFGELGDRCQLGLRGWNAGLKAVLCIQKLKVAETKILLAKWVLRFRALNLRPGGQRPHLPPSLQQRVRRLEEAAGGGLDQIPPKLGIQVFGTSFVSFGVRA